MEENRISKQVIGAALEVHQALGPGLLESACQACLAREFALQGLCFLQQATIEQPLPVHRAQLLTYLKWGGVKLGLLFNFNSMLLKQGIQKSSE